MNDEREKKKRKGCEPHMKTFSRFLPLAGWARVCSLWFFLVSGRVGSGKPVPVERLHCGERGGEKRGSCLVHEEQMRREHGNECVVFGERRI